MDPIKREMKEWITVIKLLKDLPKKDIYPVPKEEQKGYIGDSNCIMVIPKTDRMKKVLDQFKDEEYIHEPIELHYLNMSDSTGVYNIHFMRAISDIMKCIPGFMKNKEGVNISTGKDQPMCIETYDMRMILAPMNPDGAI